MNPAQRVLDKLQLAQRSASKPTMASEHVWSIVFGVEKVELNARHRRMADAMLSLQQQLDLATELLERRQVPPPLYEAPFRKARNALIPLRLSEPFSNQRAAFAEDVIMCFKWAAYTIGHLESAMTAEQRKDITARMAELEEALSADGILPEVAKFLRTQLVRLREALEEYDTKGVDSLSGAMEQVLGALHAHKEVLEEAAEAAPATKSAVHKFKDAYLTVASAVASIAGTTENAAKIAKHGREALKAIGWWPE